MARSRSGKCGCGTRIISNVVQNLQKNGNCSCGNSCDGGRNDVCASPICGSPNMLSIMAPLIYDEIGINLCATADIGTDIVTTYPTATTATAKVLNVTYDYGEGGVLVDSVTGRPNCYVVTLSGLTVQLALNLYDANGRLLGVVYPTVAYLPADITAPTYDPDTNPTSVELEIFAPYGISYDGAGTTPTPVINYLGFLQTNNFVRQGLNLYAMSKLLNLDTEDSTITVGLTLVLQSLYFAGYRVASEGKIDIPKGNILVPDNSNCLSFVSGDLLNLEIKPLDLGPLVSEDNCNHRCGNAYGLVNSVDDDTVVLPGIIPTPTPVPDPVPVPTPEPEA